MRYPGPGLGEPWVKRGFATLAAVFFFGCVYVVGQRIQVPEPAEVLGTTISQISPTHVPLVILKISNAVTNELLVNQPVSLSTTPICDNNTSCPVSSPRIIVTDANGELVAPEDIILSTPRIYVAGFVNDTYFTFLNPSQPKVLTLYRPSIGTKASYDVTREKIPVALTPIY